MTVISHTISLWLCLTGLFLLLAWPVPAQTKHTYQLLPGDLLFQDTDCGPYCEAIRTVTDGYAGRDFTHVGMVLLHSDTLMVVEAVSEGVVLTPLAEFISRSSLPGGKSDVLVGRLLPDFQPVLPSAMEEALQLVGSKYDGLFDASDDDYYCSELLYEVFKRSNKDMPLFKLAPMTFIDPATGAVFPIWQQYFDRLGVPVPEGQLGINPGAMSRSGLISIVHDYSH